MPGDTTIEDLIWGLHDISPMPDDDDLTKEIMDRHEVLHEVIKQRSDRDPRLIRSLIATFGYGEGYDMYWDTLSLLETFDREQLYDGLIDAVQHGPRGNRYWAAFMLGRQRKPETIPYLLPLLRHDAEFVRRAALRALQKIGDPRVVPQIEPLLQDPCTDVRTAAADALAALRPSGDDRSSQA